jgi:hypothetical protein
MTRDEQGVSFLPTIVLTLPWFYVLAFLAEKFRFIAAMSSLYGLPLFSISALLNVLAVAAFRGWRERSQTPHVTISPS